MYRIDDPSASPTLPAPEAALTEGYWTEGNPGSGILATLERASWFNMVQEELRAIVVAGGLTPSKTTYNQVLTAVKRIGQNTVVLTDSGAINAYAAANAPPLVAGTWIDGVVQAVKIAHTNSGASTYAPDGLTAIPIYGLGLQPLQGGELLLNGTAILMHATIAGVNSGNPVAVLMECAGGARQVAPATQSQHAVPMAQAAGVVGSTRNLSMSVTTASATATLTADEIIVQTALGGVRYCLPSFSKTINLATTGAGGMDSGTATASSYVGIYAIYNPTTGASALLGTIEGAGLLTNVYSKANMPAGYTASALVSIAPISGTAGQFKNSTTVDRTVYQSNAVAINNSVVTGSISTLSSFSTTGFPRSAVRASGVFLTTNSVAGVSSIAVGATASGDGFQQISLNTVGGNAGAIVGNWRDIPVLSPQTLFYGTTSSSGTPVYNLGISSYSF